MIIAAIVIYMVLGLLTLMLCEIEDRKINSKHKKMPIRAYMLNVILWWILWLMYIYETIDKLLEKEI